MNIRKILVFCLGCLLITYDSVHIIELTIHAKIFHTCTKHLGLRFIGPPCSVDMCGLVLFVCTGKQGCAACFVSSTKTAADSLIVQSWTPYSRSSEKTSATMNCRE